MTCLNSGTLYLSNLDFIKSNIWDEAYKIFGEISPHSCINAVLSLDKTIELFLYKL